MRKFKILQEIYVANPSKSIKSNEIIELDYVRLEMGVSLCFKHEFFMFFLRKEDFIFLIENNLIKEIFEENNIERPKSELTV